nr:polysaccharide deacetylase family protein [Candidatus Sigynarchaeota archaeon]
MASIEAYLTIDDAPSGDTPRKLALLDALGIKALLFCRGEFIDQRPEIAADIIKHGHVMGNHSYNHPYFSRMRLAKCKAQIERTDRSIDQVYEKAGIERPARVFRFPWGDKGTGTHLEEQAAPDQVLHARAIQAFLVQLGYAQPAFPGVIYPSYPGWNLDTDADTWWTFDAMEWALLSKKVRDGIDSMEKVLDRIDKYFTAKLSEEASRSAPEIIVIHDFEATANTFSPILDRFIARGVKFGFPGMALGHAIKARVEKK